MTLVLNRTHFLKSLVSWTFCIVTLVPGVATAAECKGQSESACQSAKDCSWVNAYEYTKKSTGKKIKVDGYCRSSSKSADKAKSASKQSSSGSGKAGASETKKKQTTDAKNAKSKASSSGSKKIATDADAKKSKKQAKKQSTDKTIKSKP